MAVTGASYGRPHETLEELFQLATSLEAAKKESFRQLENDDNTNASSDSIAAIESRKSQAEHKKKPLS